MTKEIIKSEAMAVLLIVLVAATDLIILNLINY
jgi:hypothetical protein